MQQQYINVEEFIQTKTEGDSLTIRRKQRKDMNTEVQQNKCQNTQKQTI